MDLTDVAIGKPARIAVRQLHVGTRFWALLSRRIENADFTLEGGRIQLPLPPLGGGKAATSEPAGDPPVTIVSIDEIRLKDVEIVSGGRTVRADASLALQGSGLTVSRLDVTAGPARVNVSGAISDISGPTGKLAIRASGLDIPALAAFLDDFSGGSGLGGAPPAKGAQQARGTMNLAISLEADRAAFGDLAVTDLSGQARVTPDAIAIEPMKFQLFSGTYDGTLRLTLAEVPAFRLKARLANVDVGEIMTFTGNPGVMTGRAVATMDVSGRGTTAQQVIASANGTSRFDVTDGTVAKLGLVRTVIVATSGRADAGKSGSGSEKFSKLGATFNIGSGVARTDDMRFESPDVLLAAVGTVRLDGQNVQLSGPLQLSEELSKQAGRDLVRYTQQDGKVTVPVTVDGPVDNLHVGVGLTDLAKRAVTQKATEEIKKGVLSGLKKIIKKE
jgi:AsmA protein